MKLKKNLHPDAPYTHPGPFEKEKGAKLYGLTP